jgi:hypothetical protein
MLAEIAYFQILGKPLIFFLGIITLLSFMFTATIAILNLKAITIIPFKWHPRMAITSLVLAIIHATLAISIYI